MQSTTLSLQGHSPPPKDGEAVVIVMEARGAIVSALPRSSSRITWRSYSTYV